ERGPRGCGGLSRWRVVRTRRLFITDTQPETPPMSSTSSFSAVAAAVDGYLNAVTRLGLGCEGAGIADCQTAGIRLFMAWMELPTRGDFSAFLSALTRQGLETAVTIRAHAR